MCIRDRGSCIIVGRCADYILRERPELLSLFIYAPLEERIKRISDLYDLTPNKAKERIMKTDKRRNTYYHYYSDRKWGDLENYHCSVDSSMLGVDGTVKFLAELAKDVYKRQVLPSASKLCWHWQNNKAILF